MKITQTVYFAQHCSHPAISEHTSFDTFNFNPSTHDSKWTTVHQCMVSFEIDPAAIAPKQVAALKEKIKEIRANSQDQITEIEGQIANLLAISYTPAPADVASSESSDDIPF
jgi:hypothetical protein